MLLLNHAMQSIVIYRVDSITHLSNNLGLFIHAIHLSNKASLMNSAIHLLDNLSLAGEIIITAGSYTTPVK